MVDSVIRNNDLFMWPCSVYPDVVFAHKGKSVCRIFLWGGSFPISARLRKSSGGPECRVCVGSEAVFFKE